MQYFTTPAGEEMVILSRKDYEALLEPPEINVLDYLIALDNDFGEASIEATGLKTARKARGLTQKRLAEKTGVTQAMISGMESGDIQGSKQTWLKLAQVLEVSLDSLV